MNYLLFPTVLIASILFAVGTALSRPANKCAFLALGVVGVLMALPGILFAAYYLKILGVPILLYQFRSIPFSELTAGGAGFLAGLLHGKFSRNERFRRVAGRGVFPGILALGLLVPYLKPILRPPHWGQFQNKW